MSQELASAPRVSISTAALGRTPVSVVCEGRRNRWHGVKKKIRLSGVASLQSASLLFVNHLLWGFVFILFKP